MSGDSWLFLKCHGSGRRLLPGQKRERSDDSETVNIKQTSQHKQMIKSTDTDSLNNKTLSREILLPTMIKVKEKKGEEASSPSLLNTQ